MTSKQRSAKQRKSRTSAETSDRREATLDASKEARHTAYESKRVWANAEMDDGDSTIIFSPARLFMGDEFLMKPNLSFPSQHMTGGGRLKIKSETTVHEQKPKQKRGPGALAAGTRLARVCSK